MRDDEVWHEVNAWLATHLKTKVIRGWQGGSRPATPYIMSNLSAVTEVRQHEQAREWSNLEDGSIEMRPVIETEWAFSLHAYSETPTDILRPLRAVAKINAVNRIGVAGLVIHNLSQIRSIPDFQNEDWEPRAQIDMNVRGLVKDGIVLESIEHFDFNWTRA